MTLDDLEGNFGCSKPLQIRYCGNIVFGYSYAIINVHWILRLVSPKMKDDSPEGHGTRVHGHVRYTSANICETIGDRD